MKKVMVVGSLNMDLVASVERLPDKGETLFGSHFATFPGGKGANQAAAAGRLGASVFLTGCVGGDSFGSQLLDSMRESLVQTKYIQTGSATTGTALITVDSQGSNTIVVIGGANEECSTAQVDRALADVGEPGVLLVQNEVPAATVEHAIRTAKEKHWTVLYNPAPVRSFPLELLKSVDVIMPNETEAALLTGLPTGTVEEAAAAADKLLERGASHVIITLGDKGALYKNKNETEHIKPYKVKAVDTTAAGDAYAGGLAAAMAEGKTLKESMQFAAAVAALSVTKAGAQPSLPRREEVETFIKEKGMKP